MGNPIFSYPAAGGRGMPSQVWTQIPLLNILGNPGHGWGIFDDFVLGASHATTGTTLPGWIVSEITDGQIVPGNETGGSIILDPASTENQGIQIQSGEAFYPDDIYNIAFGARIKLTDADQMDVFMGLCTADTDVAQSIPNDAIGFNIADASANINYYVDKDGGVAAGVDTGSDAADATYVVLEALVKGETSVEFYVDNVLKATYSTATYIPDNEALAFTIANVTGEAADNLLNVDWAYCYQWYK